MYRTKIISYRMEKTTTLPFCYSGNGKLVFKYVNQISSVISQPWVLVRLLKVVTQSFVMGRCLLCYDLLVVDCANCLVSPVFTFMMMIPGLLFNLILYYYLSIFLFVLLNLVKFTVFDLFFILFYHYLFIIIIIYFNY